jgi:hypothetical protein
MPGIFSSPTTSQHLFSQHQDISKRTSINWLANHVLNGALVGSSHWLLRDGTAAIVEALGFVHSTLKGIAFPAKHIIGMSTSSTALEAPHKRIRRPRSPQAVELGRIPDCLEGDLGHTDRVRGWAFTGICEAVVSDGVVHVRLVVGAVEIHAIPASRSC